MVPLKTIAVLQLSIHNPYDNNKLMNWQAAKINLPEKLGTGIFGHREEDTADSPTELRHYGA